MFPSAGRVSKSVLNNWRSLFARLTRRKMRPTRKVLITVVTEEKLELPPPVEDH